MSAIEPDSRFVDTDLRDDALAADDPVDLGQMAERSGQLNDDAGRAPQDTTRMIDEQPGDQRPSNG